MKAIQIDHWTSPESLTVRELPPPPCGRQEVRIRVRAAAVSHSLSLLIAGRYQRRPALPFVPGNTAAGEVMEVGAEVSRWAPGDRVLASLEFGSLAEQAVAHQDNVYALAPDLPFAVATTFNTSYNSVAAALTWPHLLNLQRGQALLVTGASGSAGLAAIEIGRLLGGTVIAAIRSSARQDAVRAVGAHAVVVGPPEALRGGVLQALDGQLADRALEPVGGAIFREALRCLRPEGRIVPFGFASGDIPDIPANLLLVKNIAVCGLYMGYYKIDARSEHAPRMRDLFERLGQWWSAGQIRPQIAGRYPLEQVPAAFAQVLHRDRVGHVVIEME